MRLLVATTATQGDRGSDFNLAFRPEPVELAPVCGRDGGDPDGACGCERAFLGIRSRRPVTTAAVAERDLTPAQYRAMLLEAYRPGGWTGGYDVEEIRRLADATANKLEQLVVDRPPGTVLERRGDNLVVRSWSPIAEQLRDEPTSAPDEPPHDNGFVYIDTCSDDLFPAWITNERWNGAVVPTFSREAAKRVVAWTNRWHAADPEVAWASWDGDDILLCERESREVVHSTRVSPDEHGRYQISDGWSWTDQRCWICYAPARPGEDGSADLQHEPRCPTTPVGQWPLAAHGLVWGEPGPAVP